MATRSVRSAYPTETTTHPPETTEDWRARAQVFLQPVAAPSILGLFGFAGATMMVGAWQAGWYGDQNTGLLIFPFALTFGGIAQFLAGMWSYRARDGLATAMHGMWGAFWMAFGLLFLLVDLHSFPKALTPTFGVANPTFAFWFVALAVITGLGAIAALAESLGLASVLTTLAVGSGFTAGGFFAPATWSLHFGGWLFVISAALAIYTAGAMMLEGSFGRTVLPLGKYSRAANIPGRQMTYPVEYAAGQPGVKAGQ